MSEVSGFLKMLNEIYGIFGLNYELALSTRPEKYLGEIEVWNKAEGALTEALNSTGREWKVRARRSVQQTLTLNPKTLNSSEAGRAVPCLPLYSRICLLCRKTQRMERSTARRSTSPCSTPSIVASNAPLCSWISSFPSALTSRT